MKKSFPLLKFGALVILIFILRREEVYSQNYCTQTLKEAQAAYDEGRISDVPEMLEPCLKTGLSKEEKIVGYRLLVLTYLYLDEPLKADQSMLMLLKLNPEFKINPSVDPSELINLYNRFRTEPVFRIGLKGGANYMLIDMIEDNSANGNYLEETKIESAIGFQLGIASEIPIKTRLEICPELLFTTKELKFDYEVSGQKSTYNETLNQLSLPVLMKYSLGTRNYIPTINAGLEVSYLINAVGSTSGAIGSPSNDFTAHRRVFGYAVVIGSGIKSKVGPGIISCGIRFFYNLRTHTANEKTHPDNAAYGLTYGTVNSLYKLNTFNLNISYLIPIYKPKKIK